VIEYIRASIEIIMNLKVEDLENELRTRKVQVNLEKEKQQQP